MLRERGSKRRAVFAQGELDEFGRDGIKESTLSLDSVVDSEVESDGGKDIGLVCT